MPLITLPSGHQYFIDEELANLLQDKEALIEQLSKIAFKRGLVTAATYIQQHPCTCTHIDLVAGILELKDE